VSNSQVPPPFSVTNTPVKVPGACSIAMQCDGEAQLIGPRLPACAKEGIALRVIGPFFVGAETVGGLMATLIVALARVTIASVISAIQGIARLIPPVCRFASGVSVP
jgi:hypothetical protein